ncbi:hypothetical protein CH286_07440 [Rhodococcus sp. WWJCD1]|uniref:DUF222 domain-containing protein n=1 Tax=Rhodococcus sp. WWJCD1 TaxID=2022519 RepID=UPI000B9B0509|nr:DUF222 domain-containing protein [Rhodococcus sp. WWJCD1]OZC50240.1 hypothetical protein CH286_07440 [Rhodococcus sp. WWJCD1]
MGAVPTVSLEALTAAACAENRQAARKISACYDIHRSWITHDTKHKHYSRYGRTEMAVALGCSATVAESYVSVGVALHTRLPLLRSAFESGEIDLPRVRTVCRILDNLSDDIVTMVEDEIVEAARRSSPGPLEKEIWDILLRVAPDEAAALREFAKKFRTVTYSPAGELTRIRAELTAPEAAAAWQLLEEMADTLCPKDPRGKKERLCDAFMARMHGEPRLACLCHREDCPKKDAVLPDRRVPLTMVTVDIATLIGLLANPAYLAGHGSIDPDLARELARNSQWQILLTEAVTLAEKLGLAVQNPETGVWERRSDSEKTGAATGPEAGTATEPDADRDTDTDADADRDEGVDSAADADAATAAHGDGATGSAADSGRDADSSTAPTSASSPAPAPENTSASAPAAPADEVDDTGHIGDAGANDESAPTPAAGPSPAPEPDAADPAQKHAATRAGAAVTDPQPEPTSDTDPETAASSEPASAPPLAADQTPPAPDVAPSCSESRSSTTPSGSTPPSDSATSRPTSAEGPAPGTGSAAAAAVSNGQHQRRVGSLTSAAALFCTTHPSAGAHGTALPSTCPPQFGATGRSLQQATHPRASTSATHHSPLHSKLRSPPTPPSESPLHGTR